ncbi:hypothetical protein BN873_260007 [Candidatus Competibacter denitrificans Run_A_D11]|uniref:Uncharacterized protein n=1 Tax=Candidatus Competibacter denitrificans Run_A_D11 TaxID=1400863 RepID=W6M3D1_9GAMM|nr:hypothetical protein BN873_260007 [Candidatus Competibacter denitrificans Run_A_D11]
MMLPSLDVQPEILGWRRRCHRMAPRTSQPLHRPPVSRIARCILEGVEHIVQPHRPQAVEQGAGILQHHPRLLALVNQLRDKFAYPLVAPVKNRRIVIIANALVIHHVLEVADNGRRGQVAATCGNQGLVHVQSDGTRRADTPEIDPTLRQENRLAAASAQGFFDQMFRTANVRQSIDILRKLAHA